MCMCICIYTSSVYIYVYVIYTIYVYIYTLYTPRDGYPVRPASGEDVLVSETSTSASEQQVQIRNLKIQIFNI